MVLEKTLSFFTQTNQPCITSFSNVHVGGQSHTFSNGNITNLTFTAYNPMPIGGDSYPTPVGTYSDKYINFYNKPSMGGTVSEPLKSTFDSFFSGLIDFQMEINYLSSTTIYITVFALFASVLVIVMGLVNFIFFFNFNSKDSELKSTYECGFVPFTHRRLNFNINFHLIAILFIVFDLEILFLFPWVTSFATLGLFGFYVMVLFFFILALGILIEFKTNVLTI